MANLKLAVHTLLKTPIVTGVAVVSLALGIGSTDLARLIGPRSMRELESDFPSHQPARSAVSVTTTSARAFRRFK